MVDLGTRLADITLRDLMFAWAVWIGTRILLMWLKVIVQNVPEMEGVDHE